uniref:N-acetyltransferase domain-containing protein n=1 Tax=Peronospora matthiolae TaxID=2874970 RepID=A0AAV1TLU6_9STRA
MTPSTSYLRLTRLNDDNKEKHDVLRRVVSLEAASYPLEEGATESMLRFRLENAHPFFLLAYLSPTSENSELLVGFVTGTLTTRTALDEASMTGHEPNGSVLCIHSVVIDPAFRRMGLGTRMVQQYTATMWESQVQVKRILLLAKAPLIQFYVTCGFIVKSLSPIVHGQDPWFELELDCEAARRPVILQIDAFTSEAFHGIPVAVVLLSSTAYHKDGASTWMQRVAMETTVSDTAFVAPVNDSFKTKEGVVEYHLRSFTPGLEVERNGHATLSAALALLDLKRVTTSQTLCFHTSSNLLVCRFETQRDTQRDTHRVLVMMNFPEVSLNITDSTPSDWKHVASALNVSPSDIVDIKHVTTDLLVHVTPETFVTLAPDLKQLDQLDLRCLTVTANVPQDNPSSGGEGGDIYSRSFAPQASKATQDCTSTRASQALGSYWTSKLTKTRIKVQHVSSTIHPRSITFALLSPPGESKQEMLIQAEGIVMRRGTLASSP